MEANFQGGDITSDGGVLLLRQVDRHLGLSEAAARALDDPRRQASCAHDGLRLVASVVVKTLVAVVLVKYLIRNRHVGFYLIIESNQTCVFIDNRKVTPTFIDNYN